MNAIVYRIQLGLAFFYYHEECKSDKPNLVEIPQEEIGIRAVCMGCMKHIHEKEESRDSNDHNSKNSQ